MAGLIEEIDAVITPTTKQILSQEGRGYVCTPSHTYERYGGSVSLTLKWRHITIVNCFRRARNEKTVSLLEMQRSHVVINWLFAPVRAEIAIRAPVLARAYY